jgi:ubiquinol-cytochrome c reductase cytochrome c1 subunit
MAFGQKLGKVFTGKKAVVAALGVAAGSGLALFYSLENSLQAADLILHPEHLPWSHEGFGKTFDAASLRRGYFVYKNVCAACHTLEPMCFRQFVDVFLTEDEAKAEAAEVMVIDGPDDNGNMYERPGKLFDELPKPYANVKAAAVANNGAAPPDLRLMRKAVHGGEDYLFALLTGYTDPPPAGIELGEGQAYNPYFLGGVLSMPQQLFDGGLEYEDGTPATQSQQAKDVATFLTWSSQPWHDDNKLMGFKLMFLIPFSGFIYFMLRKPKTHLYEMKYMNRILGARAPPKRVLESAGVPTTKPVDPFKSFAKVKFVNETGFQNLMRKVQWKDWYGQQYGLLYNDVNPCDADFETEEAISRLPPHEYDARQRRLLRADILSQNNEILPKEMWTKWDDETWYLEPYLDEIEREKKDSMESVRTRPWWWYMRMYKKREGHGDPW